MTVELLKAGLAKLDNGGWSLTVHGYAVRTLKIKGKISPKQFAQLRDMMHATGLPHRRVPYGGQNIDVWDYQK